MSLLLNTEIRLLDGFSNECYFIFLSGHVAWETNEGLALVGGWFHDETTIFHPNGTQTIIFYQSDYQKRSSCGIPDYETDTIIITGGYFKNSSLEFRSKLVNRYDKFGNREKLPEMNFGR